MELNRELRQGLARSSTCEISDALTALGLIDQVALLDGLKMMVPHETSCPSGMLIVGRAFTVQMVPAHETINSPPKGHHIDQAPPESVLFISGPADAPNALWGDLMSTGASAKGLKGAIIDGRVRDLKGLREEGFPIFARGQSTFGQKSFVRPAAYQVPIQYPSSSVTTSPPAKPSQSYPLRPLSATIHPGDLILADIDGILVIPATLNDQTLRDIVEKAHQGSKVDASIAEDLKKGGGVAETMKKWREK